MITWVLYILFSNASILVFLSEFMIKYWKIDMFTLIYESGMSFMMFTGVFEDSNQVKIDHQSSNSNPLQALEYLMKIWRFTQLSWMEINHEREICERICRDIT
jgi:hypothetical protein